MDYYGADELKTYSGLIREFAICDRWFCSHIGATLPNRHITFTGDLNRTRNNTVEIDNSPIGDDYAPSERTTFFDHLSKRGISWKLYEHGYSMLRLYEKYTFDTEHIADFNNSLTGFETAARDGALPSVSFIEPDYIELPDGNDDHAPADMKNGQQLIAKIVKALIKGAQWEKTLLVVTYDEHGGFYDHVTPPQEYGVMQPDGTTIVRPIPRLAAQGQQLGPRVPAFVVSPFVEKGTIGTNVSHIVFDHTSITATILRRFCSPNVPKMSARADQANDLRWLLTRATPRPGAEFAGLIAELEGVLTEEPAVPIGRPLPIPMRKPVFDPAFPNEHPERDDFGGFMAYASAMTGRGS